MRTHHALLPILIVLWLMCSLASAQKAGLTETHRLRFDRGRTMSLAFSPDERFLACGGKQGDLAVYEIATHKKIMDVDTAWGPVHRCLFFPDGKKVAVLTAELTVFSFPEGKLLERAKANGASLSDPRLCISPDGRWIAYRNEGNLLIRNVKRWQIVAQAAIRSNEIGSLAFSPRSKKLLIGGTAIWQWMDRGAKVENLNAGRKKGNRITLAIWPGSDLELLVATDGNELQLGEHRRSLPARILALSSSLDGSRIAVRLEQQGIRFLDTKLLETGAITTQQIAIAGAVALSPSGRILAFTTHVWLAGTGQQPPVTLWRQREHRPDFETRSKAETHKRGRNPEGQLDRLEGNIGNLTIASSIALDPHGRFLAVCAEGRITTTDLNNGRVRDLGPGLSVGQGWLPGQVLMIGGKEGNDLVSVQADLGEMKLFNKASKDYLDPPFTILRSAQNHHRLLLRRGGTFGSGWSYLWSETDEMQELALVPNPADASWSRDGQHLLVVGLMTSCVGPSRATVAIVGCPGVQPWTVPASQAANRLDRTLTGDFSPDLDQVAWGGRGGILIYTAKPEKGESIRTKWTPTVIWLRYLDSNHILTHDGQRVSLWRTRDLKRLALFDPFRVPKDVLRADKRASGSDLTANPINDFGVDRTPIFIHKTTLSRNGKRLVLVGSKDVRVFGLKAR